MSDKIIRLSNLTTLLFEVEQELILRGHDVGEGFSVSPDLKSIADTIEKCIELGYKRGCLDTLVSEKKDDLIAQKSELIKHIAALSCTLNALIQSRCAAYAAAGSITDHMEYGLVKRGADDISRAAIAIGGKPD